MSSLPKSVINKLQILLKVLVASAILLSSLKVKNKKTCLKVKREGKKCESKNKLTRFKITLFSFTRKLQQVSVLSLDPSMCNPKSKEFKYNQFCQISTCSNKSQLEIHTHGLHINYKPQFNVEGFCRFL
jgi:hypothetical protein